MSNRSNGPDRWLLSVLAAIAGCGSSETYSDKAITAESRPSETNLAIDAGQSNHSKEKLADVEVSPTASQEQDGIVKQDAALAEKTRDEVGITEAKASQVVKPKPTAEQLARWNFLTFEPLQLAAYRENRQVGFVSFVRPVLDGKNYLLGGTRLTIWRVDGPDRVHELIGSHSKEEDRLLSFAVSPDGSWCVAGNARGQLRKFDLATRKEVASVQTESKEVVLCAISPDGKEIATLPYKSEVTTWDAESLKKKYRFNVDAREVKLLQYVTSNSLLASGESMSQWDTTSGERLTTYPAQKFQTAVGLTSDARQLIFGAKDALQRWSLSEQKAVGEYQGVPSTNAAIRFTDDGALMAIAVGNGVQILAAGSGQLLQVIDASGSSITDVCWIPKSQVLIVTTETGRTRIWGRVDECRKLGIENLPAVSIDVKYQPGDPAIVAENLSTVDLRLLPRLPNSLPQNNYFHLVNYIAPTHKEEVKLFYRYVLDQRGWADISDAETPDSFVFIKEGYRIYLSTFESESQKTNINLSHLGRFDTRDAPRYQQGLKSNVYESPVTVTYQVESNLLEIESGLLKAFYQAGWTNIVRLNQSQTESGDTRTFEFLKNGTVLNVLVQPDSQNPKLTGIQYSQALTLHALPVPADAGLMEWDDSFDPQMVASTSLSLTDAATFYDSAMKSQGWSVRDNGRRIEKELAYLPYYWGQRDVTISLERLSENMVRIRAGKYSDSAWQKPEDKSESVNNQLETEDSNSGGLQAADVPILHGNGTPKHDVGNGSIRIVLEKTSLVEIAKSYTEALLPLGWTAKPFGEPLANSVNIHFEKGSNVIYYQSSIDPRGMAYLTLSGNGLLWTKPIGGKQLVSYAQWLRNSKLPATLKYLDQYQADMTKQLLRGK